MQTAIRAGDHAAGLGSADFVIAHTVIGSVERKLLTRGGMEEGRPFSAIETYRTQRREALTRAFLAQQQPRDFSVGTPRSCPRARLAAPLTLHWHDWETDLTTFEVSARGCSFFAGKPAQDHLRFSLQLPNGAVVRGLGTVVASIPRGDYYYVCVRFDAVQSGLENDLADAVLETLLNGQS